MSTTYIINPSFIDLFTNAKFFVLRYEDMARIVREDDPTDAADVTIAALYTSRKEAIDVAIEAAQELCPTLFQEIPRGYLDSMLNKRRTLDVVSTILVRSGALEVAA